MLAHVLKPPLGFQFYKVRLKVYIVDVSGFTESVSIL